MSANDTQVGGQHYKGKKFQPWDWDKYGIGTYEMDILHYITRVKNGKTDLEKAVHYTEKLLEEYTYHDRRNRIPFGFRMFLHTPIDAYCDEWNMSKIQRQLVRLVVLWETPEQIRLMTSYLKIWIHDAYPDGDVRPGDAVEAPKPL